MRLATLEAALEHWKRLATERMVCRRYADVLDVSSIQPRSMLAVVASGTSRAVFC